MFGLIEEMKGVGKQKKWDLQLYRSLDGIERVFCQRNDRPEVYTWVDEEDVACVINYLWNLQKTKKYFNYLIRQESPWDSPVTHLLHRDIFGKSIEVGFKIDHISHYSFDNTRKNLRFVTVAENRNNSFAWHYSYDKTHSKFKILICKGCPEDGTRIYHSQLSNHYFDSEKLCLSLISSEIKSLNKDFTYDIKSDFSERPEYLEAYYRGEYSFEEAQRQLMMHYADNILYWFRFDLFDYFKSIGVEEPEWSEDSEGFLVDKNGTRFCDMLK